MNYKKLLREAIAFAKRNGMTMRKISIKSGVTDVAIYNWLNGNNTPNIHLFIAVINACGKQINFVMSDEVPAL